MIKVLCLPQLHHGRWSGIVLACTVMVMWVITLCRLIGVYECTKGAYSMHIHFWWTFIPSGLVFTIFTWMQDEVFSLNSSSMWGRLKFAYELTVLHRPSLDCSDPDHQIHTMVCITILSCEICALLRYYRALSGNSLVMCWDNLSVPSTSVRKSKRMETEINWNSILFCDFIHYLISFEEARHIRRQLSFHL
jgi:hypothetical protein